MIHAETSAGRTVAAVRELILRGEFPTGARLGEVELAERLGVSRTPVREALSRLAAEGLVEIIPNRGARVTSWTVAELEGVFDLRTALEPRLTALAVPNAAAADVAALDELASAMLAVGAPGPDRDLDALVPLNRTFHGRLVALADQAAMAGALASAIHAPIVLRNFHTYDEASLRRSLAHHVEIVAAVRAGDPAWAQAVMTAHIRNARAVMVRAAARPREATAQTTAQNVAAPKERT
ncbi:MAG TPA: GntR family transcriptional regulator [Pseudonocardia sp.]